MVLVIGVRLLVQTRRTGDSGLRHQRHSRLVTGGLFGLTRNPIFSAAILIAAGIAVVAGNIITVLGTEALVIAFELQVRHVEEPYLRSTHGDEYAAYATRVGRFAPGIGRLS